MGKILNYLRKEFFTMAVIAMAGSFAMGGSHTGVAANLGNVGSYQSIVRQLPFHGAVESVSAHLPSFSGFSASGKGYGRSFALGSSGPIFLN